MLLMSVVSVWAEELSETIIMTEKSKNTYTGTHFTIEGTSIPKKSNGLLISGDNRITITANDGERITKVIFNSGTGTINNVKATKGEYEYVTDHTISGVNDTSFQIYTVGVTVSLTINEVTIYYEVNDAVDGDVQPVSFIPKTGLNFSKENITVTGTYTDGDNYGLRIDNGKSVTIASNNGVTIQKVDLHLSIYNNNTDKKIISTVGNVSGNAYDWSINNVNSTSLTISHPGGVQSEVEIDNIVVYYIVPYTFEVAARKADVSYWATFYSSIANYQAPEDTKVFKVNFDGSSITMTEIEDRIVTKGQGVVLKTNSTSNPNTVNIVMNKTGDESFDDYSGNSLKGTDIAISNPGNAYVLNYKPSEGLGFYRLSSTATIPANRAYLTSGATVAGATAAAAREFFAFDAAITGIDNVNAQDSEDDVKTFDLQGRRVTNPAKGVYIVNGKKVIMK